MYDAFVESYLHPPGVTEWLNPFDPEQINVEAEFYYLGEHHSMAAGSLERRIYGFYYEEFERNIISSHPDSIRYNNWLKDTSSYPFRIRFAPTQTGNWAVKIKIQTPFTPTYTILPINFKCVSSSNPGYVKVGSNERFLQLGDQTFIPIGTNLPHPTCYECIGSNVDASELYQPNPMGSQGFVVYLNEMEDLHNNGGNYFRMFMTPAATEIEFEHLGNYANRMNRAWEVDKILEKAGDLDLYIHFNMEIHYVLESPSLYGMWYWDWLPNSLNTVDPEHEALFLAPWVYDDPDPGFCYKTELGLTNPIEFFSNANAIKFYKQKIRYMISRWGYSTNIALWELFSETDNCGSLIEKTIDTTKTNWAGYVFKTSAYRPYWEEDEVPPVVEAWNKKIAKYIKVDLEHSQHLISAEYTGGPSSSERANNPARNHSVPGLSGPDVLLDLTYSDENVDVNCWSQYAGANIDRFAGIAQMGILSRYIEKPILLAETGPNNEDPPLEIEECDNNAEFIRSLWCTMFSGAAGPGLDWNALSHDLRDTWKYYGVLKDFLYGNTFAFDNWEPQHDIRNDSAAEVFSLVNHTTAEEVMGVIVNRTYNYYTQAENTDCQTDISPGSPYDAESNVIQYIPVATQNLKIYDMATGSYLVSYYDAITGDYLGADNPTVYPFIFSLYLDHPTLCLTSCFHPLIAFKAEKIGGMKNMLAAADTSVQHEFKSVFDFEVRPNPAVNNITVWLPEGNNELNIRNTSGQVVYSNHFNSPNVNIDISPYQSGLYLITLQNGHQIRTKKLVIQHENR